MSTNYDQGEQVHEFHYGRSVVGYRLLLADRQNLAITVRPDKSVIVRAPIGTSLEAIHDKLQKRGGWVLKQINYFDRFHPIQPPRQYVGGEAHFYLGRKYRLRLIRGRDERVILSGKFFLVITKTPKDQEKVKLLMLDWYATHANIYLHQRVQRFSREILEERSKQIRIEYRIMKTRWGSCLGDNLLKFNIELVKAPVFCIDYVVIHELCHMVAPNHDLRFYTLLGEVIPDWRERKARLEVFFSQ